MSSTCRSRSASAISRLSALAFQMSHITQRQLQALCTLSARIGSELSRSARSRLRARRRDFGRRRPSRCDLEAGLVASSASCALANPSRHQPRRSVHAARASAVAPAASNTPARSRRRQVRLAIDHRQAHVGARRGHQRTRTDRRRARRSTVRSAGAPAASRPPDGSRSSVAASVVTVRDRPLRATIGRCRARPAARRAGRRSPLKRESLPSARRPHRSNARTSAVRPNRNWLDDGHQTRPAPAASTRSAPRRRTMPRRERGRCSAPGSPAGRAYPVSPRASSSTPSAAWMIHGHVGGVRAIRRSHCVAVNLQRVAEAESPNDAHRKSAAERRGAAGCDGIRSSRRPAGSSTRRPTRDRASVSGRATASAGSVANRG